MTSSAYKTTKPKEQSAPQAKSPRAECVTRKETRGSQAPSMEPSSTPPDDRKTPPTIADGTRKGAAKGPAHDEPPLRGLQLPVEEPSPMRAWRLDEKPTTTRESGHSASPLTNSLHTAPRSVRQRGDVSLSPTRVYATPRCPKTLSFSRARRHTQPCNTNSLKSCRSDATPRARAPHIARARCGNAPARAAARKSA